MFKKILAAAILFGSAVVFTPANAAPLMPQSPGTPDNIIAVRDGCGAGRHFSPRLGRCVLNYYGGPAYYGGYGYGYRRGYVYRGGGYRWHGGGHWHGGGGRHWHGGGGRHHGGGGHRHR